MRIGNLNNNNIERLHSMATSQYCTKRIHPQTLRKDDYNTVSCKKYFTLKNIQVFKLTENWSNSTNTELYSVSDIFDTLRQNQQKII